MKRISRKTFLEAGSKGGKTTLSLYGREHFVNLAKRPRKNKSQRSEEKENLNK